MSPDQDQSPARDDFYRLIAEHASDVVFRGSNDGVLEWLSPSVESLVGWTPGEMAGRPFLDYVHPDDVQAVRDVQAGVREGVAGGFKARLRTETGGYRWISVTVRPVFDDHGEVAGRVGSWRDAQAEMEADEARRRTERELRALVAGAGDVLVRSSLDRTIVWVSESVTAVAGWLPEELIGTDSLRLAHADDATAQVEAFHAGGAGRVDEFRVRVACKDGAFKWFRVRSLLSAGPDGAPEVVAVLSDIDDQVHREDESRRRERLLRTVTDGMLDPQILLRLVYDDAGKPLDFVYEEVNRVVCEHLGKPREQLIGMGLLEITPSARDAGIFDRYVEAVTTGEPWVADGVPVSVNAAASLRYDISAVPGGDGELSVTFRNVTERYEAAQRVAASEEHFRSLFDAMNQGVVFQDGSGAITDANRAAERILGLTLAQLQGRDSSDPRWRALREDGSDFPGEEHPSMLALRSGRKVEGVQMGVYHPESDSTRWILVDAVPQFHPGEQTPCQVFTVFTDITELAVAQAALAEREEQFRDIFDHSFVGHGLTGLDGRFIRVNDALARMLGCEPAELEGAGIEQFTFPDDDEAMRQRVAGMVEGTSAHGYARRRFRAKDGSVRWGDVSSTLQSDADGRPLYFIGSVVDVTEQVAAAAELARLQEMRDIAEGVAHVGSVSVDLATMRSDWSPEVYRLLDVPPDTAPDFFGVLQSRVHPDDRDVLVELRDLARKGHEMPAVEFRVVWRDGSEHILRRGSTLERDAEGRPVVAVGYLQDVTQLRVAEAEISERSRQAEESAALLEAANSELESFSYSVSHDLRAPLRAIDGFSEILAEDYASVLDDEGLRHLQRIRAGAQRMGRLIDDLLAFSRAGRGELKLSDVDIGDAAALIVDELAAASPERAVEVAIEPGCRAVADRALTQVLLGNLLSNAWKFTSHAEAARIEVGALEQDGDTVFFVRDNGAGFERDRADEIFQPFVRLHPQEEFAGSGIGLATVQRIVARHGGRCWAEGEVGEGATFFFTLGAVA